MLPLCPGVGLGAIVGVALGIADGDAVKVAPGVNVGAKVADGNTVPLGGLVFAGVTVIVPFADENGVIANARTINREDTANKFTRGLNFT